MDNVQTGSKQLNFEILFENCYKQLFTIAYSKTRNYHDAQDAVQEAFYYAYKNINKLRHEEFFKTWITRILLNYLNKYYIRKKREQVTDTAFDENIGNAENDSTNDELILMDALKTLDKKYYDIVILRYFACYSVPEIAKSLGIPEGTVKSRLSRSIEKLKIYFLRRKIMNNIENRISGAAKSFTERIVFPEIEELENKEIKRRRNPFILKRAVITALIAAVVIAASGITVAGLNGVNVIDYFFGDTKFQAVQEKGQVNITNMKAEKDGISTELKAIFSDEDTIYLSINASGTPLEEFVPNDITFIDGHEAGNWVINRIKEVYITNRNGDVWKYSEYKYDKIGSNAFGYEQSPVFDGNKNGAILQFHVSPKEDVIVNIKIEFKNGTIFDFKQADLKVIPTQHRDLSNENYYVQYPHAVGHVKEVIYNAFKTTFVVDWKFGDMDVYKAGNEANKYILNHRQKVVINNKEYFIMIIPSAYGTDYINSSYSQSYDIYAQATPQDKLEIKVYNQTSDDISGTLDSILLTIPGEE